MLHYLLIVSLDRWNGSSNTLNNLSNETCVPNKTEDVKIKVFNMVTIVINQFNATVDENLIVKNIIQNKNGIHAFFRSNTFISNARLNSAKH